MPLLAAVSAPLGRLRLPWVDLPLFGMHVGIDGASWTCGAVRGWDVDGLADGLEALLA